MRTFVDISDKEKPGRLIGRITRADTNTVLYHTSVAAADDKGKSNVEEFTKKLNVRAKRIEARANAAEKSGVTPDTPGKG